MIALRAHAARERRGPTPRSTRRGALVARRFRACLSVVWRRHAGCSSRCVVARTRGNRRAASLVATGTGRAGERVIRLTDGSMGSKKITSARTEKQPPPVLNGFRVLEWANLKAPVKFSGHTHLYVDRVELGAVQRLALAKSFEGRDFALLHCTRGWNVFGIQAGFSSVAEAKRRAERTYVGVTRAWNSVKTSAREARAYQKRLWLGQECSFCGRVPPQVQNMMAARQARICNLCVAAAYEVMGEASGSAV